MEKKEMRSKAEVKTVIDLVMILNLTINLKLVFEETKNWRRLRAPAKSTRKISPFIHYGPVKIPDTRNL